MVGSRSRYAKPASGIFFTLAWLCSCIALFALLMLGGYLSPHARAADPAPPRKVFIGPFQGANVPADQQWIGGAIGQTLNVELGRTAGLTAIRQAAPADRQEATQQTVLKAARHAQTSLAVFGSYEITDGQAKITTQILDVKTGDLLTTEETEGAVADLLKVEERLAGQVRKVLLNPTAAQSPSATPAPMGPAGAEVNIPPVIARPPATRPRLTRPAAPPKPRLPPKPRNPPLDAAHVTDADVREAIQKGCDYLLDELSRHDDARRGPADWDWAQQCNGGLPMLALYALLQTGRVVDDPRLRFSSPELDPYVQWALQFNPHDAGHYATYTAGLQAGALALLPPRPEFREQLKRIKDELLVLQQPGGGYSYTLPQAVATPRGRAVRGAMPDNSNSQYGLLGIWAAADADIEVPMDYWRRTDTYWRERQLIDGSWPYLSVNQQQSGTATMTAAGLASLLVTREYLNMNVDLVPHPDAECEHGMVAMDRLFNVHARKIDEQTRKAGWAISDGYYLFGMERVALASGRKTFNHINWYRQGAATLLNNQYTDGSWAGAEWGTEVQTAYVLLFLARGMSPVAVNKLQYKGYWNARDRDAANLVNRLGKRFERPMSWQIVNLAEPEDFLDAPLLLITGSQDVQFTGDDIGKLRAFVEAGGTIFSAADGQSAVFTAAMRRAAAKVFQDRYEMRPLPRNHPVFNIYARIERPMEILGASNGVREYWIHSPADLGAAWQGRRFAEKEKFDVAANILFYVSAKEPLRRRLETLRVPDPEAPAVRQTRVLRFQYAGNWDPEPGAWRRMAQLMACGGRTELQVVTGKAADVAGLDPRTTPLVHLTGTAAFTLADDERRALRGHIERGGTLLVEAAGGAGPFTTSATQMLAAMFPDIPMETIPRDDPLYSGRLADSANVANVEYSKFWQLQQGGASTTPRLWGLKINGRWAVLVSPENLSNGFLGTHAWGIAGYTPAAAEKLGRSIILYAHSGGVVPAQSRPAPAPAAAPTTQAAASSQP